MNQAQFSLTETTDGTVQVDINGTGKDLIDLLATAIESNDKIKEIITMALIAVEFKGQYNAQLN